MLACDADIEKIVFPVLVQPKIDGVRALNLNGYLTGRSLKPHGNRYVASQFSHEIYSGLDGEMFVGCMNDDDLCRKTTSALNSYEGQPDVNWALFDFITDSTIDLPYEIRFQRLCEHVADHMSSFPYPIQPILTIRVEHMDDLLHYLEKWQQGGYEGMIVRDPLGKYKQGRSTIREGGLLRIKTFCDAEAEVIGIMEGQTNQNPATIDERGYTARSNHQENMIANGMVGSLLCKDLKTEQIITVAAGKLTQDERRYYFENQNKLIGQIIKYKYFPKGVKDKPRFPTFQTIRITSDL
jgi:DNA ligase-1